MEAVDFSAKASAGPAANKLIHHFPTWTTAEQGPWQCATTNDSLRLNQTTYL